MSKALAADKWDWTPEREACLDMFMKGVPKVQIAKTLDVHRNTINSWCFNPAFLEAVRRKLDEHKTLSRMRRIHVAEAFREGISTMAVSAVKDAQADPRNPQSVRLLREMLGEYRACTAEERTELGEDVKRIESRIDGSFSHNHSGAVGSMGNASFKQVLLDAAKRGLIDPEVLAQATNPAEMVQLAMQQALINDESILNTLHDEDRAAEQEEREEK